MENNRTEQINWQTKRCFWLEQPLDNSTHLHKKVRKFNLHNISNLIFSQNLLF